MLQINISLLYWHSLWLCFGGFGEKFSSNIIFLVNILIFSSHTNVFLELSWSRNDGIHMQLWRRTRIIFVGLLRSSPYNSLVPALINLPFSYGQSKQLQKFIDAVEIICYGMMRKQFSAGFGTRPNFKQLLFNVNKEEGIYLQ